MNIRRWTATALLATAAVAVTAGGTNAAPIALEPPPGAVDPNSVPYEAIVHHDSVVTELKAGAFSLDTDGNAITARDDDGTALASIPLHFDLDGNRHRIAGEISDDGRTLRLAPDIVAAAAQPVASPLENQLAANEFAGKIGQAGMAGSMGGAAVGAIIGLVIAVASCVVLTFGCLIAGLPIVGAFAAGGGVLGTILISGGTVITAGLTYLETLQAMPGESRYAGGLNEAGVPNSNFRFPKLAIESGSGSGSSGGSGG
ncbi:hypothetical protein [Nocardia neocaledoniensis]|uniref:hypothetical protein n=1 Tax=Nocardia neocaledoniensis TaxID=236511 RepID=UPI00245879A2|nr:hypothetical protein [Nocardia neocaledoniensis]